MLSSCWKRTITTAPRAGPQMLPSRPSATIRTKKPFALKSVVVGLAQPTLPHGGSFFNAGVRAYDIRDPFQPREVAAFVPEAPAVSPIGAIQINDVYVAADGIVYVVDRSGGGLCILQFIGTS